jgi:ABC-type thiamin/hydroxymethylpyrimidine transport system permease subunit
MLALARLVRLVATVVALIIIAAIVLRLAGANAGNSIVHDIHSVGSTLAGPFKNIFSINNAKTSMAVNWGLAAAVYLIVGHFIASLLARLGVRGYRRTQPVA